MREGAKQGRRPARYLLGLVLVTAVVAVIVFVWRAAIPMLGVAALAFGGLAGSNLLYDRGVPRLLSRRFAPVLGGFVYLAAVLWLDAWPAIMVTSALTIFIVVLRIGFPHRLRGVRGNHPAQRWAEVTYPVAGTLSLLVGWGILGNRWLAFLPVAFMAWGDTTAGLARDAVSDHSPTVWTMAAMLLVCLGVAAVLFHPYWIAAIGAAVATVAERFRPGGLFRFWDDNLNIVAASLTVMSVITKVSS